MLNSTDIFSLTPAVPPSGPMPGPGTEVCRREAERRHPVTSDRPEDTAAQMAAALGAVAEHRDKEAFARLFRHFAPRLKAYMIRQGAPPAQAEDLAQEAMVLVWRKAHLFDSSRAAPATWIFTIARNLRIDALRKERHPEVDADDPAVVTLADEGDGADEQIGQAQRAALVRKAMQGLPPDQMEVVRLSFFSDKPHSQIAQDLGLPMGTVKSRLRLAMKKIRAALDPAALGDVES